jgi:hypothetical protein
MVALNDMTYEIFNMKDSIAPLHFKIGLSHEHNFSQGVTL